jgi:glucose/arabinose dehydrogenase
MGTKVRSGQHECSVIRAKVAALLALATLAAACTATASGSTPSATTTNLVSIGAGLKGRAGLVASVYATGLADVSALALDADGRLWVATSGATGHSTDAVYEVAAAGATPVKVISGLKGPLGLAWYHGTMYVSSIGRVDAFSDLRGTRFAHRHIILSGPVAGALNGGLLMLPSGRFVMSVATSCDHCAPSSRWSATIVSFRPDGSDLRIYASGVRDAFGLAYDETTGHLYASLNQRDDLGANTPGDWLAMVKQGDDWGFPACYGQGGSACAGVPKPVAELDTHAGAGGVAIVSGGLAGTAGTSALVAEWATGKVLQVGLSESETTVSPYLTGLKAPLALLASAKGLLVSDWTTGTIYLVTPR